MNLENNPKVIERPIELGIPAGKVAADLKFYLDILHKDAKSKLKPGTYYAILKSEPYNFGRLVKVTWTAKVKEFDLPTVYEIFTA